MYKLFKHDSKYIKLREIMNKYFLFYIFDEKNKNLITLKYDQAFHDVIATIDLKEKVAFYEGVTFPFDVDQITTVKERIAKYKDFCTENKFPLTMTYF